MNIEAIKDLSAGSARLLSLLQALGDKAADMPTKEMMRLSGIPDRSNFYRARKSLVDAGLIAITHRSTEVRLNQE